MRKENPKWKQVVAIRLKPETIEKLRRIKGYTEKVRKLIEEHINEL